MMSADQILQQGLEYHTKGNLKEAEKAYHNVLALVPNHPDALHFLGVIALNVNRLDAAKELILKSIQVAPDNHACYLNLGNVFQQEGNVQKAFDYYERSKQLNPTNPKIYNNIGVALSKLGRYKDAVGSLHEALRLAPDYPEACNNLSENYRLLGRYDKAQEFVDKAIALQPNFVGARWNKAILLLLLGDLETGFEEYEWRWQRPATPKRIIEAGEPWLGQPLEGKTVFVYEEQGLGDTFQFVRYLPFLQEAGGKVIFEALPPLVRMVYDLQGVDRLYVGLRGKDTRPVDRFDYHVPLLSLPRIMKTKIETIPGNAPYLFADPNLSKIWKARMKMNDNIKIGVVWAGHPDHNNDANRSVLLSSFEPISNIPNVSLFSIQKEKYGRWTDIDPDKIFVQDLGKEISDFADTAAIIDNLDLIISVDTSVVHLAGGMGKEVWTLLPFSPDWRWMTERSDSPWYPSMRLLRQPEPGDWESVFKSVAETLKARIA